VNDPLPVAAALPSLRAALASGTSAVLQAPPGAGKTTTVPLALIDEPWLAGRRIVMLEPRRVAARAAAHRMASLCGEPVGTTVGFRTRTETRVSAATLVEVVTEGILTRRLQRDPTLEDVGLVIFDEFHERSLVADLGLALTLHSRSLVRDDLRILVMSATLDTAAVARILGDAPIVAAQGRVFAIDTRYAPPREPRALEAAVASTVRGSLAADEGDILVFLPGAPEIHRVLALLASDARSDVDVLPLHGALSSDEQDAAISPATSNRRRVVLATSIAETSLTIPGVRVVIDAGLARRPRFSPRTGMTRLETVRVSRAAADQRRGRAGRTATGVCYRLWEEHEQLVPGILPEIVEADLAPLAVDLAAAGVRDPSELRWIDPPAEGSYRAAQELLRALDLIDAENRLTAIGKRASALPLHPRLAHMIGRAGHGEPLAIACDIAALLGERDFLRMESATPDPDIRLRLEILASIRARRGIAAQPGMNVQKATVDRVAREADRLRRTAGYSAGPDGTHDIDAGALLAGAYPDRVGKARPGERGRYVLRAGIEATVDPALHLAGEEFLIFADLDGKRPVSRGYLVAPIEREAVEVLFAKDIITARIVEWNARDAAVLVREQRRLGAIILDERDARADPTEIANALMIAMLDRGILETPNLQAVRSRLQFAHHARPAQWPAISSESLRATADEWLLPNLIGLRRLSDVERIDWNAALLSRHDGRRRKQLDLVAPTHFTVPTGSRIPIDYSDPSAPFIAVRLQELFGLAETPRIGGGAVPLTLHLLSPANRPVQVTRDLAGFWKNSYFDVRKDLRGRYPRHPWPDDPLTAPPTRRVKPR
jgi:ATP-dependent helicase HrpB